VPWWKRIIINRATITLDVKHYKDDGGIEHIDIDQTLTGGLKGEFRLHVFRSISFLAVYGSAGYH
jgi:hypothetical protein